MDAAARVAGAWLCQRPDCGAERGTQRHRCGVANGASHGTRRQGAGGRDTHTYTHTHTHTHTERERERARERERERGREKRREKDSDTRIETGGDRQDKRTRERVRERECVHAAAAWRCLACARTLLVLVECDVAGPGDVKDPKERLEIIRAEQAGGCRAAVACCLQLCELVDQELLWVLCSAANPRRRARARACERASERASVRQGAAVGRAWGSSAPPRWAIMVAGPGARRCQVPDPTLTVATTPHTRAWCVRWAGAARSVWIGAAHTRPPGTTPGTAAHAPRILRACLCRKQAARKQPSRARTFNVQERPRTHMRARAR